MNIHKNDFGLSLRSRVLQLVTSVLVSSAIASGAMGIAKADTVNIQRQVQPQAIAQVPSSNVQTMGIVPWGLIPIIAIGGLVVLVPLLGGGLVIIGEKEVGIVVKKFSLSKKRLPAGQFVALAGEAGYQADTLAAGWHWGYWSWQYSVGKQAAIVIPQGEIALVVAADGAPTPPERILGKVVDCDNFQDARKFLTQGGEKGRQMAFLTAGTYRINTALFKVITASAATAHGMKSEQLHVYTVMSRQGGHCHNP